MNVVFLDTVGLLALWNAGDQWHSAAEVAFATIGQTRAALTTTSFVLLECANAAARRPYRQSVERLRERLESSQMLVFPTDDDWRQAWTVYRQGDSSQPGVVDCVSFAVMRRLGITRAFTNDRHFQEAGFETLF
ncbi:MAG TPA: PIN domain-containing protein [Thermoguttaceae bacterium]|nr:PIN domain-containing protein [Thermoguttaceae bacterium]